MTADPIVVEGDEGPIANILWAMWDEDGDGNDAHIGFWRTTDGRLAVQSMQSNREVRGRAMLQWLSRYGLPIHVVEAVPEAYGFWERMLDEGRIVDWQPADGLVSDLERISTPFPEACKTTA